MARVAIEFDDNQIFLASMQTASRRSQLKHVACIPASGTTEEITAALEAKINEAGLTKSDACVVIGRDDVELRLLDVPPAPKNELPGMVRFLAKNKFASLNDSWMLDFVRLSGDANTTGRVMAAGLSPESKKRFKQIVGNAGLRLRNIVFRPYAITKYLSDKLESTGPTVLVEPIGDEAEIMVMQGKSIIAVRKFKLTGDNHTRQLEREIKRTVATESATLDGKPLSKIILLGKSESLEPIGESLANSLDVGYEVIDPEKDPFHGSEVKKIDDSNRVAALIGALSESDDMEGLDFLNPRQPTIEKRDYSKWRLYGWVAAAVFLLMCGFGWWTLSNQSKEIQAMQASLASITAKNQGNGANQPAVEDTLQEVGAIDDCVLASTNWQENLLTYSQHALTADDAIVDRLEGRLKAKDKTVTIGIQNRAADNAAEAALVEELSKVFDVALQKTEFVADDEYKAQSNLTVAKTVDTESQIKQIDKRAEEFLKTIRKANASAANNQTNNQ